MAKLKVIVKTNQRQQFIDKFNDLIRVGLKSTPVENKANLELIKLMADRLNISRMDIEIISGHNSKTKLLAINGFELNEILTKLGLAIG